MLAVRSTPLTTEQTESFEEDEFIKRKSPCTIFLGYTSNMASCGVRDCIRFLVQHKLVCKKLNIKSQVKKLYTVYL